MRMKGISALADATRRRIVEVLARGPLCSGEIAARFAVTAPAISQHLKALRAAKLVRVTAVGQRRIYELDREGVDEIAEWIEELRRLWAGKRDASESAPRK